MADWEAYDKAYQAAMEKYNMEGSNAVIISTRQAFYNGMAKLVTELNGIAK